MAALAAQQDELSSIVTSLDEAGWQHASRCEGWSVADVVLHLAQTNEMATASLQGRLLALFDDFGYRRIGISCRLANGVCTMAGLQPRGDGFAIVEGAGLPRLDIVGFNRRVDWDTLVERLAAVGSGDVSPVFD